MPSEGCGEQISVPKSPMGVNQLVNQCGCVCVCGGGSSVSPSCYPTSFVLVSHQKRTARHTVSMVHAAPVGVAVTITNFPKVFVQCDS